MWHRDRHRAESHHSQFVCILEQNNIAMKLKRCAEMYGRLHRFWLRKSKTNEEVRWICAFKIHADELVMVCLYKYLYHPPFTLKFLGQLMRDRPHVPILLGLCSSHSPVCLSCARHHLHRVWFTIPGKNWFVCVCLYKIHILFCVSCESFNLIFILWWYSLENKIHDQHVVIDARTKCARRVCEYFFLLFYKRVLK